MEDLKKEFVPYQEALELKELGFAKLCFGRWVERDEKDGGGVVLEIWNDEDTNYKVKSLIKAPLYQQAFRFFREEYDLFSSCDISNFADKTYGYVINSLNSPYYLDNVHSLKSIEEAELACLRHLIEIGAQEWFNRQLDEDKK